MVLLIFGLACIIENGVEGERTEVQEPQGELSVDPDYIDFGLMERGTSWSETFTITSVGTAPVDVEAIDITAPSSFVMTLSEPLGELPPGESLTVVVDYTANTHDEPGHIAISSDALEPRMEVGLWGGAIVPALAIEPAAVSMNSYDGEEVREIVTLSSVGTATLELTSMLVLGDPYFEVEGDIPLSLEPGESAELEILWTPSGDEYDQTEIWLTDNTPLGSALIPVEGIMVPPCIGLAEAWEVGTLHASTSALGSMRLKNIGAEDDICVDRWTVWISTETQDMGLGDPYFDPGQVYPSGSITLPPGATEVFNYGSVSGDAWYCIEQTQVTVPTSNWDFFGARVPSVLLSEMIAGDQDSLWEYLGTNPTFAVGRNTNVVQPDDIVELRFLNLGRRVGTVEVSETLPEGWDASNWSQLPTREESHEDGTTFYFELEMAAAVDTPDSQATIYDDRTITYELERAGGDCASRMYFNEPEAAWVDSSGAAQTALGSPLLVLCE
ncbi:MAG TPA: choice-of-anchor D domain-containing protein [Myxococcota bacterium]|nr:choice-of-anchor D domain-containing protein [Myxococcota bacterium]